MTKRPNVAMAERLRAREIVTVRCARCSWSWTGPALHVSQRGRECGALARQKAHLEACRRKKENASRYWRTWYTPERRKARVEALRRRYREDPEYAEQKKAAERERYRRRVKARA